MRRLLIPLVPIYAAVIGLKAWLRERGVLRQRRLAHPVISVGSLSAGGAGKTPVVMLLAELLQRMGFEVRILTRGYGRKGTAIELVDPDGDAAAFGDEPMLMARRLKGVTVWVGADRYRAGKMAERNEAPGTKAVYLLDDGFQHRRLARDVDLVLVTQQDLGDRLLPAGNLREPLKALGRADVVLVREDEADVARVEGVRRVWVIRRRLKLPEGVRMPSRPVVFCGLARPAGFFSMLAEAGVEAAASTSFRDHHPYSEQDVERLVETAREVQGDGFVTTEKDAVKLAPAMMERLGSVGVVVVAELRVELVDEKSNVDEVLSLSGAGGRGSGGRSHPSQ